MSDNVIIPGLGNSQSSESIKKIMDEKTKKLTALEKEKDTMKEDKKAWSELKTKTLNLQSSSKKLYNQEAPFDEKLADVGTQTAFTATAKRNADIGEYTVEIKNKAKTHRIASDPQSKNFTVPSGDYKFIVGNDKVTVPFAGGSLESFSEAIKKFGTGILKSSITYNTTSSAVLVIESVKYGKDNFISFDNEKSRDLFKKMNFYEEVNSYDKPFSIDAKSLTPITDDKRNPTIINNSSLLLDTDQSYKFTLKETIQSRTGLILEINMKLNDKSSSSQSEEPLPTGPNFSKSGDVTINNIYIEGEGSIVSIPPYQKKEEIKKDPVTDNHFLEIVTNKRTITIPELEVTSVDNKLSFKMNDIITSDESVLALNFKNNNTLKKLEVSNIRFFDENSKAGIKFKNELSKPENAELIFNGLKVERNTNQIDDLLKGVTIEIFDKTVKPEKLLVDRNYPKITETLVNFIKEYNEFIKFVNDKTKIQMTSDSVDTDKTTTFTGESLLTNMSSKMRLIMMNSYPTNYGQELSMLSQIGISTNNKTGSFDAEKINSGGVLEIDENKFVEKMQKYPDGVKQLFGFDKSGDQLTDSGIGFDLEYLLKQYTMNGSGFYDQKQTTLDSRIKRKDTDIADYKKKLDDELAKLKETFYKMEKAQKDLQDNTKKLDSFNKQN